MLLLVLGSCTSSELLCQNDIAESGKAPDGQSVVISKISITGNKVTKDQIILRELAFAYGDTISLSDLERLIATSKANLLNKPLFNYVNIGSNSSDKNMEIHIHVEERWYMWPSFLFTHADRNLNAWFENKDMSSLQYGFNINKYNFRGANEVVKLKFRGGYTKSLGVEYRDIFIDKQRRHSIGMNAQYNLQQQIEYGSVNNKPIRLHVGDTYAYENYTSNLTYSYRKHLFWLHSLQLSYAAYKIQDTVAVLNENYLGEMHENIKFWTLAYYFLYDKRDRKYYPIDGYYAQINAQNVFYDKDINYTSFSVDVAFYQPLSYRTSFAVSTYLKTHINQNIPYLLNDGLGYSQDLTAYEYYVVNGHSFAINKIDFKYQILKQKVVELSIWPLNNFEQFNKIHFAAYIKAFAGFAYVYQLQSKAEKWGNTMANNWLYSFGLGIDLITYYDKIVRIDWGVNKMGEQGVFFHFKQGI